MITVTLYSRADCHLCDLARDDLNSLRADYPHRLVIVDIDHDEDLEREYGLKVPVVEIGPYRLTAPFERRDLQVTLGAAIDRARHLDALAQKESEFIGARRRTTRVDRFSFWFTQHYLMVFNLFVFIYVGLPFTAPALMRAGAQQPAAWIYRAYGAVCHQLAFRSWFLYGEQPVYPRQAANVPGYATYGEVSGLDEEDLVAARAFIGNERLGYKVAFCERDVAIYGGILLFGLIFAMGRRRIPGLPWYLWILLGIMPIAVDGFSQLLSQPPFQFFDYRESTPLLRTLTGGLFGFATAWFGYPHVEQTMQDTRRILATNITRQATVPGGDRAAS